MPEFLPWCFLVLLVNTMYFISQRQPRFYLVKDFRRSQSIILNDKRLPKDREKTKCQLPLLLIIVLVALARTTWQGKTKHPELKCRVKMISGCKWHDHLHRKKKRAKMKVSIPFIIPRRMKQNKGKKVQAIAERNQRAKTSQTFVAWSMILQRLQSSNRFVSTLQTISTKLQLECTHTEKSIRSPYGTQESYNSQGGRERNAVLVPPKRPVKQGSPCRKTAHL